ncbi:unnamed protein product [Amoebophrya sp. A120]|nr:unnamed protein product [Amoebophrya sp. A120]|eukprot:GSA120T00003833001.1
MIPHASIWLPRGAGMPPCASVSEGSTKSVEVKYPFVYWSYQIEGKGCTVSSEWDWYPFDQQQIDVTARPNGDIEWLFDYTEFTWRIYALYGPWSAKFGIASVSFNTHDEVKAALLGIKALNESHAEAAAQKYPGISQATLDSNWQRSWPVVSAAVTPNYDENVVVLTATVERDSELFAYRLFLPCVLLGLFAFSTFIVTPDKMVPRFMSGFLAFLALQAFRKGATDDAPDTLTKLSYLDALLMYLTLHMSSCMLNVIMGEVIFQIYGPLVVRDLDSLSKRITPGCFFCGMMTAILCIGADNTLGLSSIDTLFVILTFFASTPVCSWFCWYFIVVSNGEHFYLYNCMRRAQYDPAAPCVLQDKELSALFRWIGYRYGFAHEDKDEPDEADDHLLRVDDVARFVVDTVKGELEMKMCVLLIVLIHEEVDENKDGKVDVAEFKRLFPFVIHGVAKGSCDLKARSRLYLLRFYLMRMLLGYKPVQYIRSSTYGGKLVRMASSGGFQIGIIREDSGAVVSPSEVVKADGHQ